MFRAFPSRAPLQLAAEARDLFILRMSQKSLYGKTPFSVKFCDTLSKIHSSLASIEQDEAVTFLTQNSIKMMGYMCKLTFHFAQRRPYSKTDIRLRP